jgi:hypothetical protein
MKRLRSCDGCARHVFVSERVCPFCLTELAPAPERETVPIPSGASRAQRLALAAALGSTTLLACSEAREAQMVLPVYGAPLAGDQAPAPPPHAGSTPPAAGRGGFVPDGGFGIPVYGAPAYGAPFVAGQPAPPPKRPDAAVPPEDDAGVPDQPVAGSGGRGGMSLPVYGASPIPEYGAPPPPKD